MLLKTSSSSFRGVTYLILREISREWIFGHVWQWEIFFLEFCKFSNFTADHGWPIRLEMRPRAVWAAACVMTAICNNKLCLEFITILLSPLDNGIIIALIWTQCVSAIIYLTIHHRTMSDPKYHEWSKISPQIAITRASWVSWDPRMRSVIDNRFMDWDFVYNLLGIAVINPVSLPRHDVTQSHGDMCHIVTQTQCHYYSVTRAWRGCWDAAATQ